MTPEETRAPAIEAAPVDAADAIRTLATQGYGAESIAAITGINQEAIRRLLGQCEACGE